jgi:hypothetical protein
MEGNWDIEFTETDNNFKFHFCSSWTRKEISCKITYQNELIFEENTEGDNAHILSLMKDKSVKEKMEYCELFCKGAANFLNCLQGKYETSIEKINSIICNQNLTLSNYKSITDLMNAIKNETEKLGISDNMKNAWLYLVTISKYLNRLLEIIKDDIENSRTHKIANEYKSLSADAMQIEIDRILGSLLKDCIKKNHKDQYCLQTSTRKVYDAIKAKIGIGQITILNNDDDILSFISNHISNKKGNSLKDNVTKLKSDLKRERGQTNKNSPTG